MYFLGARLSELVALVSLSTTLFLFLHTRDLTLQLSQERLRHTDDNDDDLNTANNDDRADNEAGDRFHFRELSTASGGGDTAEEYGLVGYQIKITKLYCNLIKN